MATVVSIDAAQARLRSRETALIAERQRILDTHRAELSRVDVQLAATRRVTAALGNPANAGLVDQLLAALDEAGVRVVFGD